MIKSYIYIYLKELIEDKYIDKEMATTFNETFQKQKKITKEQYDELKELIDVIY